MSKAITSRQWPTDVIIEATFADQTGAVSYTFQAAPGDLLANLTCDVDVAFNAGTTNTITVTDGTTVFMNGITIGATGRAAVSNLGKFYPTGGTISVTLTQTGTASTAGDLILSASFKNINRTDFEFGT